MPTCAIWIIRLALAAIAFSLPNCSTVSRHALPVVARFLGAVDGVALLDKGPLIDDATDTAETRDRWSVDRISQARADNRLDAFSAFAPVLGPTFRARNFPGTHRLLDDVALRLAPAVMLAKQHFARPRPFLDDPALATCIPPTQGLRASGSYPSGHAAFGWAWALILASLAPTRAEAILQRGLDFGESRVVCGLHYPSDVLAGRKLAAATVARLDADPDFRKRIEAARAEFAKLPAG